MEVEFSKCGVIKLYLLIKVKKFLCIYKKLKIGEMHIICV